MGSLQTPHNAKLLCKNPSMCAVCTLDIAMNDSAIDRFHMGSELSTCSAIYVLLTAGPAWPGSPGGPWYPGEP